MTRSALFRGTLALGCALLGFTLLGDVALADKPPRTKSRVLKGHDNFVIQTCMSADAKLLASVAQDGTVRLWALPAGKAQGVLKAEEDESFGLIALSASGKKLAVAVGDKVRLYSVGKTLEKTHELTALGEVTGLSFDTKAERLAVGGSGLRVFSVEGGTELSNALAKKEVGDAALSPSGETVAVLSGAGLLLLEAKTGKQTASIELPAPGRLVRYLPSGKQLAVVTRQEGLVVMDDKGAPQWSAPKLRADSPLGLAQDGKLVLFFDRDDKLLAHKSQGGEKTWWVTGAPAATVLSAAQGWFVTAGPGSDLWLWKIP